MSLHYVRLTINGCQLQDVLIDVIEHEFQQERDVQSCYGQNAEINGGSGWKDVCFSPVELLVIGEKQVFRNHPVIARRENGQLQAAGRCQAALSIYVRL